MRRLFIIRKDLHLSGGKLAAMVGHCCEAYWTNWLKQHVKKVILNAYSCCSSYEPRERQLYLHGTLNEFSKETFEAGEDFFYAHKNESGVIVKDDGPEYIYVIDNDGKNGTIDKDIYENYVCDIFTKTICEAKNLTQLLKAADKAKELGMIEGSDYGFINDKCLTELTPENDDGTCTIGIWFKPLEDVIAHEISKKYQLYKGE